MASLAVGDVVLRYDEHGAPDPRGAPPLLLLHGYTGLAEDFAEVAQELVARGHHVLAYDHRGHGGSTNLGDEQAYTFDLMVDDVSGFLDGLDLGAVHLLGHSMGGVIAQWFALAHPERVRSLILMDTAPEPQGPMPLEIIDGLAATGRSEGMGAVYDVIGAGFAAAGVVADAEKLRQRFLDLDPAAFSACAHQLSECRSVTDQLGEIAVPTTVLVGSEDVGLRPAADVLAERIPGATLVVFEGAGHSPQGDVPDEWVAAVDAHLQRAPV